jgi:hypothetical protein
MQVYNKILVSRGGLESLDCLVRKMLGRVVLSDYWNTNNDDTFYKMSLGVSQSCVCCTTEKHRSL